MCRIAGAPRTLLPLLAALLQSTYFVSMYPYISSSAAARHFYPYLSYKLHTEPGLSCGPEDSLLGGGTYVKVPSDLFNKDLDGQ
ncbi:hypothetical protein STEG23_004648 [Scotinomys teguina]